MTESTATSTVVQVHRVFIKATAQAIWDAIVDPAWNCKYGYHAPAEYDLRPGGAYRGLASQAMRDAGSPDVIIDGEVISVDPPHRLVQTWRALFGPATAAEGPTRVTWEIAEIADGGICRVTVTHELDNAPVTAETVGGDSMEAGGGWSMMLSDLKTLLETGSSFQNRD
ncbi:MAG TPA: SRPBCC domain-containing protein [Pseudonocardiaceae bacterium]|jgi:uncharacterized protein YndB with AHSA1/START domain